MAGNYEIHCKLLYVLNDKSCGAYSKHRGSEGQVGFGVPAIISPQ